MLQTTTHVGMDVHKKDIAVAMLAPGETEPIEWTVRNDQRSLRKLVQRLKREAPGPIEAVYEAGPCGYTVQRQMQSERLAAHVIAPALVPVKPGGHPAASSPSTTATGPCR